MSADRHRFLVLHGLRLRGFAEADAIADLVGLDVDVVGPTLESVGEQGLARRRDGKVSGWMPTAEGRTLHAELVVRELEESGARPDVDAGYRRFLGLNDVLKQVCTTWQLRDGELNDHTDPAYDRKVIDDLLQVHLEIEPVSRDLHQALERYLPYGGRLARAARRVDAGDHDWFTGVTIDSYHTVWFQLHEDLLVTLGIDRSEGDV